MSYLSNNLYIRQNRLLQINFFRSETIFYHTYDKVSMFSFISSRERELIETDPDIQKFTGFEFLFTSYSKKSSGLAPIFPPPRYKMVIVTIPVISLLLSILVPPNTLCNRKAIYPIFIKILYCTDHRKYALH
jgi:hypothetical protein